MSELYKPSKKGLELVAASKQRDYQNNYYDLQEGKLEADKAAEVVALLAKSDAQILEEMQIKKAINALIVTGKIQRATLISIGHVYNPEANPPYIAPGLELLMNDRNAPNLLRLTDVRFIRPIRNVHEGLWGIEITGEKDAKPGWMTFGRMLDTDDYLERVLKDTPPLVIAKTRSATVVERSRSFFTSRTSQN